MADAVLIPADALRDFVSAMFTASGCGQGESARIAQYLTEANLVGHDSHGVIRTPRYLAYLADGLVRRDQRITIVTDGPSFALVDGNMGFGQTVTPQAVDFGIQKANEHGVAVIGLRNSGHLGRAGDWAERAVSAGLVSIHFVNVAGSQLVAPFGGVDRRISTAPFSAGVPRPGQAPIILDFATSLVAEGKVLVAANGGKPLPQGALVSPDGVLSADPAILYGPIHPGGFRDPRHGSGAIRAFGEHKGSGLAFLCEILAGALTGGGMAGPAKPRAISNGMLSVYLRPDRFAGETGMAALVDEYVTWWKSSRPVLPGGEVLIPGEVEARNRAHRLAHGVPLQPDTWRDLLSVAERFNLSVPAQAA